MSETQAIQLFDGRRVRTVWDDKQEKWYFSVVDVVYVLTDSPTPRKYWSVLKTRLKKEGSEVTTICSQLKLEASDGKKYMADVADTEQLFRIIQSIPSPKAARRGGRIARNARTEHENQLGRSVISSAKALPHTEQKELEE